MFDDFVKVDANVELFIEISIDLIEIMHINTKFMGLNNG